MSNTAVDGLNIPTTRIYFEDKQTQPCTFGLLTYRRLEVGDTVSVSRTGVVIERLRSFF